MPEKIKRVCPNCNEIVEIPTHGNGFMRCEKCDTNIHFSYGDIVTENHIIVEADNLLKETRNKLTEELGLLMLQKRLTNEKPALDFKTINKMLNQPLSLPALFRISHALDCDIKIEIIPREKDAKQEAVKDA